MIPTKNIPFIFSGFLLVITSCNFAIKKVVGITDPKEINLSTIIKYSQKYNIPEESNYFIDTSLYFKDINPLIQKNKKLHSDLIQPLQVKIYDDSSMIMFLINCNVGGFPNLQWNRYGSFSTFPPDASPFKKIDTTFSFLTDIKYYKNKEGKPLDISRFMDGELNIVVFWTVFMNRQSKILIDEILQYKSRFKEKKINLAFVNVDHLFSD